MDLAAPKPPGQGGPSSLEAYGWNASLQEQFGPYETHGLSPGRVIVQQRDSYRVMSPIGDVAAHISGRFSFSAAGNHPDGAGARLQGKPRYVGETVAGLGIHQCGPEVSRHEVGLQDETAAGSARLPACPRPISGPFLLRRQ